MLHDPSEFRFISNRIAQRGQIILLSCLLTNLSPFSPTASSACLPDRQG
jgi:hypothetical protein